MGGLSTVLRGVRGVVRDVVDFCYPGRCAVCEGSCNGTATLCDGCATELAILEDAPACDRCAMPIGQAGDPCPHCLGKGMRPFERVVRLGVYRDPLRQLVRRTKYEGRWPLAEYLADRLFRQDRLRRLLAEADCLVPVPLHRLRQMSRGYNQADVLARRLARLQSNARRVSVVRPVLRVRHTETQTHLHSRAQREANLRDAFGLIKPAAVRGKRVVIVDDVMTTGATLRSVARVLRLGRPRSLSAVVVAIADPRHADFQKI